MEGSGQSPILISFPPPESGGAYLMCIALWSRHGLIVTYNVGGLKYSMRKQNEIGMGG
jgi:hypothetical protein